MQKEKIKTVLIFFLIAALLPAGIHRYQVNRNPYAREIPVFTYHRICPDNEYHSLSKEKDLWTKTSDFEKEMGWLHNHGYRTISMDELYRWHQSQLDLPKKTVAITFDDGYYSVIRYGLPIMKKYHIKATMFVIGNMVTEHQNSIDPLAYVSLDTIREMGRNCPELEFQSHSYGLHHDSNKNAVIYRTKYPGILRDFQRQEKVLGKDGDVIAYPYGYGTEGFESAARESGYKMAFLYGQQRGVRQTDNVFRLPRIGVRGDVNTEVAFFRWLKNE